MSKKEKIASVMLLVIIVAGITALAFYSNRGKQPLAPVRMQLSGNRLLSVQEYMKFSGLTEDLRGKSVTLSGIKKVFEKHPYIKQADVDIHPGGEVTVLITERPVAAVLLAGNGKYLLDFEYNLIPLQRNTREVDFPVITNCPGFITPKTKLLRTQEIKEVFTAIAALQVLNSRLAGCLAEINLRNGGDVVLAFNAFPALVLLGKSDFPGKLAAMAKCFDESPALFEQGIYVDLRFRNRIFIREAEKGNV